MKKFCAFSVAALLLLQCSCSADFDEEKISQLRSDIFVAEAENLTVYAYAETVEEPIKDDGCVGEKKTKLTFKTAFLPGTFDVSPSITVSIGDETYKAEFDFTPAANYNYCQTEVKSLPISRFSGVLSSDKQEIPLEFVSLKNPSAYTYGDMVHLAVKTERARKFLSGDDYEIRVRLLDSEGYNYWYIGLIKQGGGVAFLFDAENAELIASKDLSV